MSTNTSGDQPSFLSSKKVQKQIVYKKSKQFGTPRSGQWELRLELSTEQESLLSSIGVYSNVSYRYVKRWIKQANPCLKRRPAPFGEMCTEGSHCIEEAFA